MGTPAYTTDRIKELLAAAKAKQSAAAQAVVDKIEEQHQKIHIAPPPILSIETKPTISDPPIQETVNKTIDWEWNAEQQQAINLAASGKSFCLIGAAGTGKTTTTREIAKTLIQSGFAGVLQKGTKRLSVGAPGIIAVSFTRRAVRNLRKAMPEDMKDNCLTIHKLLEYEPVFYEIVTETGDVKKTMRFEPTRNRFFTLPREIKTIIFDESSMVDTELFAKVIDALPHPDSVQLIFLGDLYQLPPVYGRAILGFKLLELPVVELVHVYRQALLSPIIRLAHKIKNGELIPFKDRIIEDCGVDGKITIHPWKKRLSPNDALKGAQAFFKDLVKKNEFNPEDDVILCPYNVEFGTEELNRAIAQQYGDNIEAEVSEVIAGFRKHYFAVGDRILFDREDCRIIKINRNMAYIGKPPQPASKTLDRWGTEHNHASAKLKRAEEDATTNIDTLLESLVHTTDEKQERSQAASHVITLIRLEDEEEFSIDQAGEINELLFSYALTIHKAQGSEWNRVFVILHNQHSKMVQRELLYTAVTRARKELYIICEPDREGAPGTLTKGSRSAKIRGISLKEKIEFFAGVQEQREAELAKTMEADRLKQNLLDPAWARVRIHAEKVEKLLLDAADKLAEEAKRPRPVFEIGWKLMGATAGLARYQKSGPHQLLLNPIYLYAAEEQFLAETPLHELAHIFAWDWHKQKGHGAWWEHYMKKLGLEPKIYHQWGKATAILKQLIEVSGVEKHLLDGENDACRV